MTGLPFINKSSLKMYLGGLHEVTNAVSTQNDDDACQQPSSTFEREDSHSQLCILPPQHTVCKISQPSFSAA